MVSKLVFIIPYFGRWPFWMPYFLRSCALNPSITWLLYSDCGKPEYLPSNVRYHSISFTQYCARVSERLGVPFSPVNPYKLCDLKPALGHVHEEDIAEFDFWGFSDLDLIYGDLRAYFTEEKLQRYAFFSTHERRVSGHLCLMRNNKKMRLAYREAPNFLPRLSEQGHHGLDEGSFTRLFLRYKNFPKPLFKLVGYFNPWRRLALFEELYSTPNAGREWLDGSFTFPTCWQWENGRITTDVTGNREFLYFHFLGWKKKFWRDMSGLAEVDCQEVAYAQCWHIDRVGFHLLGKGTYAG